MLAGLALVAYVARAIAWPFKAGRDLDEYLYAYVQLFDRHVLLPWSILFRTPITPLWQERLLDVFDGRLAEPLMALLYAGSIVCWAGRPDTLVRGWQSRWRWLCSSTRDTH